MFEKAIYRIERATRDAYIKPEKYDRYPVQVVYKDSSDNTWDEWEPVLDRWLPLFEEAGWLDGLERIEVGNRMINDDRVGEYSRAERVIRLKDEPIMFDTSYLVGYTKPYLLIHEMIHHVHMRDIFNFDGKVDDVAIEQKHNELHWNKESHNFYIHVSEYAATNFLEAVAETGAGLCLGEEYPDYITDTYKIFGGPEPL